MIDPREDELHFLKQVSKYLKWLEHLYTTTEIKDPEKTWYVQASLCNTERIINKLKTEMEI